MADPIVTTAPEDTGRIQVVDPQGQLMTVPAAQLAAARAQGYQVASQATVQEQAPAGFTGFMRGAQALDESLLRGATAGLSDPVINKLASVLAPIVNDQFAGRTQKEIEQQFGRETQQLQEEHPLLTGAGEFGGMIGGTLLGAGIASELGGAARGGSYLARAGQVVNEIAPLRAIESVGGAVGTGTRALVGRLAGQGALGRAAATGLEYAARGGIETGLYSGVRELSEEMLGDPEINGEKLAAASLAGAGNGALFGLALGAGGSLVASGARGAQRLATSAASRMADDLQGMANEQRWRALDPKLKYSKQAEARIPGGVKGVGETLGEYGITGDTISEAARTGDVTSIEGRLDEAVSRIGSRIGELQAGSTGTVPLSKVAEVMSDAMRPFEGKAGLGAPLRSLKTYGEELAQALIPESLLDNMRVASQSSGPSEAARLLAEYRAPLQDVLEQRKALDQLVFNETKSLDPNMRVKALRGVRAKLEELVMTGFDDAAKASGNPGSTAELRKLKLDYQRLRLAQDAASDSSARMVTNRNLSLSDYLAGGTASHVGAAVGGFVGGAPGAAVGGFVGGVAGAAVNRMARKRGNAIAAAAIDKLASMAKPGEAVDIARVFGEAGTEKAAMASEGAEAAPAAVPEAAAAPARVQPTFTHDIATELGATTGSPQLLERTGAHVFRDQVPIAEAWKDMWRVPSGYKLKITNFEPHGEMLRVHASIAKGSDEVGTMTNTFYRDAEGKLVAKNDDLILDQSAKNKGIGAAVVMSGLNSYKELGVDRVEFYASLRDGARTWARPGVQWSEQQARETAEEIREYVARKYGDEKLADELSRTAERGPAAVAKMAVGGQNIGREFLNGSLGWAGHLPLQAAHGESAEVLQKAASFARAQQAIATVDAQISRAAKAIVEDAPEPKAGKKFARSKPEEIIKEFDATMKRIESVKANPSSILNQAIVNVQHLPITSQHISTAIMRSALAMTQAAPRSSAPPSLGRPLRQDYSLADMQRTIERARVAANPMSAFHAVEHGEATINQAQALKLASPPLFLQLQEQCIRELAARQAAGAPVSFEARQRMHLLLGIQTDPSQSPGMAATLQSNLASLDSAPGKGPTAKQPSSPKRGVNLEPFHSKLDQQEEK